MGWQFQRGSKICPRKPFRRTRTTTRAPVRHWRLADILFCTANVRFRERAVHGRQDRAGFAQVLKTIVLELFDRSLQ